MRRHEPAGGKDRPGPDWGRYRRRLEHEIGELTRRAVEYVLCRRAQRIGRTDPHGAYVTGEMALNLPREEGSGGWHEAGWHLGRDLDPIAINPGTTEVLGTEGIVDIRQQLRKIEHPAGLWILPVWGATYWRAMIDWAAVAVTRVTERQRESGITRRWPGSSPRHEEMTMVANRFHPWIMHAAARLSQDQEENRRAWQLWIEEMEREMVAYRSEPSR